MVSETSGGALSHLRSFRLLDIAVFDVVATLLAAVIAGRMVGVSSPRGMGIAFIILLLIGIMVHWALRVDTKLNFYLGLSNDPRQMPLTDDTDVTDDTTGSSGNSSEKPH